MRSVRASKWVPVLADDRSADRPTTASVAWLEGPGQLMFREERLAAPGRGQLLCETILSAISPGTEIAAYTGLPPLRPGPAYPRLQGYCNVARVLGVGEWAGKFAPGDVVLTFASHRSHFLIDADDVILTLEDGDDPASAACTYLFHLGYSAVLSAGVRPGSSVSVIGLGVLGLASVAMAAIAGARVTAISDHESPRGLAADYGASRCFSRERAGAEANAQTADVVIATTGAWGDWDLALFLAARRGMVAALGFPGRGQEPGAYNPLESRYFYGKQLTLKAAGMSPERADSRGFLRFNERANMAYIAELMRERRLDARPLISGRYPARDLEAAYRQLVERTRSPVTYLLDWQT